MKHDGLQAPVPDGWGRIHDIRWFSENLNSSQFRALSTGLGLGSLKAAGTRVARAGLPQQPQAQSAGAFGAGNYAPPPVMTAHPGSASAPVPVARSGRKQKKQQPDQAAHQPPRLRRSMTSRLSVWTFDFLVVVVSLAVAFAVAVVLSMVKTGETDNWLDLRPVRFLADRSGVEILAAVYAIFAVYMIVFKLGAGKTFGEVIFRPKQAKSASSVTS
jgi:hypothetical protein